jgi:uncharacterized protein YneF (UPF0154 family)
MKEKIVEFANSHHLIVYGTGLLLVIGIIYLVAMIFDPRTPPTTPAPAGKFKKMFMGIMSMMVFIGIIAGLWLVYKKFVSNAMLSFPTIDKDWIRWILYSLGSIAIIAVLWKLGLFRGLRTWWGATASPAPTTPAAVTNGQRLIKSKYTWITVGLIATGITLYVFRNEILSGFDTAWNLFAPYWKWILGLVLAILFGWLLGKDRVGNLLAKVALAAVFLVPAWFIITELKGCTNPLVHTYIVDTPKVEAVQKVEPVQTGPVIKTFIVNGSATEMWTAFTSNVKSFEPEPGRIILVYPQEGSERPPCMSDIRAGRRKAYEVTSDSTGKLVINGENFFIIAKDPHDPVRVTCTMR